MQGRKKLAVIILCLFAGITAFPQTITGTWKGRILDVEEEYLEINIVQVGNKLCGFTGDYVLANPDSYCKAYFTGRYVSAKKQFFLEGTDFIQNSGTHVLMQLLVSVALEKGKLVMRGFCRLKPEPGDFPDDPSVIVLRKTSLQPSKMTETMKNCVKDNTPEKPSPKPVPAKPVMSKPKPKPLVVTAKPVLPKPASRPVIITPKPSPNVRDTIVRHAAPVIRDTIKTSTSVPEIPSPVMKPLPPTTAGRVNKDIRTIIIHQKKITLYVYDNAEVDGDSISIFYNGRLLLSHMRLAEKPIKVEVTLDETAALHSIVLFAENLGAIPPNTALIIFTDDRGKRYELFAKADLGTNAELVFKYEP